MTGLKHSKTADCLNDMRSEISADTPLFAERLADGGGERGAGFSDLFLAAAGDDVGGARDLCLALEYIFEGYLLHYREGRLLEPDGGNFDLLAGDYMYARGLNRLTALGDPAYIRLMSGLISFCSQIHCEEADPRLALGAWTVTTLRMAARAAGEPAGGGDRGRSGSGNGDDNGKGTVTEPGADGTISGSDILDGGVELLAGERARLTDLFDGRRDAIEECLGSIDTEYSAE